MLFFGKPVRDRTLHDAGKRNGAPGLLPTVFMSTELWREDSQDTRRPADQASVVRQDHLEKFA